MRPAVFLDRDGVLNRLVTRDGRGASPRRWEDFHLLSGVEPAVEALKRAGLLVVVVTNQPDIARGLLMPSELERMHESLRAAVRVDAIYTCRHDDRDACACRKPKPGLLLRASEELAISLGSSCVVGDSWKDIAAGQAAGCRTFLLRRDEGDSDTAGADFVVPNLQAAAEIILGSSYLAPAGERAGHPEGNKR